MPARKAATNKVEQKVEEALVEKEAKEKVELSTAKQEENTKIDGRITWCLARLEEYKAKGDYALDDFDKKTIATLTERIKKLEELKNV